MQFECQKLPVKQKMMVFRRR